MVKKKERAGVGFKECIIYLHEVVKQKLMIEKEIMLVQQYNYN